MNPRIETLLTSLYGASVGDRIALEIRNLGARIGQNIRVGLARGRDMALTERDVLLITYADQVTEPGVPPLRALARFCERHLGDRISGVHLLPFYPSSSDDGFSVQDYLAVDPAFGAWNDVAELGARFDLMMDGVFNHVSAQGAWFRGFLAGEPRYRDFFITVENHPDLSKVVRPRALPLLTEVVTVEGPKRVWTTFSADQVDLNYKSPEVLLATVEALLFYASQGARFIRLDAIAFLWKEIGTNCLHLRQTHQVVQLWRAILDEIAPHVLLITETNVPHADNLSYLGDGENEAQLVYNFALPPLVLHAMSTGHAEKLSRWAQSLVLPSDRVTFFNFLASHDGIGLNPARGLLDETEIDALVSRTLEHGGFISYKDMPDGSRLPYEMNINFLDALSNPLSAEPKELAARKTLTAHAMMFSLQGVPGIYFHSLFGSRGDRAGAETSGIPRRINRQKLKGRQIEAELAESDSIRALVFRGFEKLLEVRRSQSAFHPRAAQEVLALDPRVFAICRNPSDPTERVVCLHNVSDQTVRLSDGLGGLESS
ncbi:MAG TPA: sugar phosphorylase, partial [Verrucomicrobiota bacterium]|nr:sugar phosphorylase [Verrucomicrobiota bacterium]